MGKERDGSGEMWTEGKPREIAWGRSDTEATIGWTDGKLWEIAWGEVRGEGARWKLREGGQGGNRGK